MAGPSRYLAVPSRSQESSVVFGSSFDGSYLSQVNASSFAFSAADGVVVRMSLAMSKADDAGVDAAGVEAPGDGATDADADALGVGVALVLGAA